MNLGRPSILLFALVGSACTKGPESAPPSAATPARDPSVVAWADVRAEMDEVVCVQSFEHPEMGTYEVPLWGDRKQCAMPAAATPLERAVERMFTDARDVVVAFPDEQRAAQEAVRNTKGDARIVAVRDALFTDRYLAPMLRRLPAALAAEGLSCADCPSAPTLEVRTVSWSDLAPYIVAYVWPDAVVTPRGADGTPAGKPSYSMHICVGLNGLATLPEIDETLRFAALLAAFNTDALHERAAAVFQEVLAEKAFLALRSDDEKTAYLRANVGPRVAADSSVRRGVCSTLERLRADAGVRVEPCDG